MSNNIVSPSNLEMWEAYIAHPFNAPSFNGVPDTMRLMGVGSHYEDGATRRFGAGIAYLGTPGELQAVRLDWDSKQPHEALPAIVGDLAKQYRQGAWRHVSYPDSEIMQHGSMLVAGVTVPKSSRYESRQTIRVVGSLGDVATNPLIEALIAETVVPDSPEVKYAEALSRYITELRTLASEKPMRNVA